MDALLRCYTVIDIESISLDKNRPHWKGRFSKIHNCQRNVAVECYDSSSRIFEFCPCIEWKELTWRREQKSFEYCQRNIHGLSYYPFFSSGLCLESATIIQRILGKQSYRFGSLQRWNSWENYMRCYGNRMSKFGTVWWTAVYTTIKRSSKRSTIL